jgi:hypothetical protein
MNTPETKTLTEANTGCWLDAGISGHHMPRRVINLAQEYGFMVNESEERALSRLDVHPDIFPLDALIELSHDAVRWLNSGQEECDVCAGTGLASEGPDKSWHCWVCMGTGRGPRVHGQNFPPRIPDGYRWDFNDGDFGLYPTTKLDG